MNDFFKTIIFKTWFKINIFLPQIKFIRDLDHRIKLSKMHAEDIVRWRVEKAREQGAKVGNDCKLFSFDVYSEPYLVELGNNVIVSGNVIFITHDGAVHLFKDEEPHIIGHYGKITIGSNCFIGMGSIILPNVSIGDNCIIGAGSVVMSNIKPNNVVIGNPAKVVFNIQFYKKMKLRNINTLRHEMYNFTDPFAEDLRKETIMKHFICENIKK